MMSYQFALLTLLTCCYATPPPGYVKPPEVDKYPPKYEYGYTIQDNKGSGQGKLESREGVFSLGRYFVQLGGPKSATQNVQYITDEWGYHPLVEYSSIGDHSQTSTQFALGEKAVEALRKNVRDQNPVKNQVNQIVQNSIPVPSPTQATVRQQDKPIATNPSPSPVTIIQSSPVPNVPSKLLTKSYHPVQENIPILQNAIPLQYVFQPFNLPQAQYLIQPQIEPLPQPQFLIQEPNLPQTQFIIPLFDGLDNTPQIHQININVPANQNIKNIANDVQIRKDQNKNNNLESQTQDVNINLELKKKVEDKKVSFVSQTNEEQKQNTVINIPKQEVETIKTNSEINNNGQYLFQVKKQPQQNVVVLPQTTQDNNIVIHNDGQVIESSTLKYNNEKLKQEQDELEYIAQAIQNDLNLQNTEPLFGNIASEVRYSSNKNSASSSRYNEQNSFDETILNVENPGGYGSRIKAKKINSIPPKNNQDINFPPKNNQDINTKLIDRTRNLVTGVDVLNINDAITNFVATAQAESQSTEQNKNIINEYASGNVQYGYNENVPNTILEVVSNFNNKNILNNIQEQKLVSESYENSVQQSTVQSQQQNNLIESSSTYNSKANEIQNSRNKLLEILNGEKIQIQEQHISLAEQPIIVADLETIDNSVQSTTANYKEDKTLAEAVYSTTQNTVETKITENSIGSTESPVLITPRPVSNSFLAPITAAVSLQNSATDIEDLKKDNYAPETSVEIQKSIPYYLGKIEFIESQENLNSQQSFEEDSLSTKLVIQNSNVSNEQVSEESSENFPRAEALILTKGQKNLNVDVNEQEKLQKENISVLEMKQTLNVELTAQAQESKIVNKPAEITKIVEKPYPVEIPIGIPYPVEKQVPIEVEKIIEKPIHITKIVEKPVPVHIPQPYPVEVEKIIERQVKVPFEVTKYVNNPYPVHIPYPEPVAIPVEVEKLVQTVVKEPYPVEIPVPVEVPVKVPVPHPVSVTKYIEKPYPVEKIVEKQVPVEKIVEKPITKYIDKPYPVPVHIPVPHPIAVPVEIKVPQPYPIEYRYIEKPYGLAQAHSAPIPKTVKPINHPSPQQQQQQPQQQLQIQSQVQQQIKYQTPVTKLVQIPLEVSKYFDRQIPLFFQQQQKQNPYLYAPKYQIEWRNVVNCDLNHKHLQNQNSGQHGFAKITDYIGLVPPVPPPTVDFGKMNSNYKRKARNSFEQNLRIEYGFKPPIIPSVQTDEFGMPLNKDEK